MDLSFREQIRQQQLDKFWELWSGDYIRNLPPTVKGFPPKCNLKKGSLVLIKEDNIPRMSWPCGIVLEVFPGKDGLIRSVKVKTAKGIFHRPIQRLHDLEINNYHYRIKNVPDDHCSVKNVSDDHVEVGPGSYTRRGHKVKPPERMNL